LGPIPEIRLALETPLITDADGRFQTPRVLDADGEYAVVVRVPGFVPAQSNWKALTGGQPLQWGDLQLNRRRPLEGQVVDRQGQPVAGAKVVRSDSRSLLRTSTDASGHFKFELVVETPGFLFVEADGFRFHGQISDATKPVRVSLTRNDEPVANVTRSLPPAISKEQSRTLVAGILTSEATKALDEDKDEERSGPLEGLARTDPARVLEILEKKPLKNEWFDGYVRRAVVKSLLKESPEEARTVADSIRDPSFRVFGYLDLYDAASREQADLRRQLLAQALLHARAVKEADHRVIYLGRVAERLLAAGEKEQASKIFSEGKDIAKALPTAGWSAYARAAFATSLSVVDLPAALNLTGDLKDAREFDRHHGNIARKIARTKPSEAERVLGMVRQQWHRDQYAVGVCWRMAPVEMNRARVIADRADNVLSRAQAYGALAQALTKTDKNEAIRMLRRAFAILGEKAAKGEQDYNNFMGSSSLAAMLVGVAEGIDPGLVSEFLWKAVSFRVPRLGEVPMQETHPTGWFADAALAYAVARYDRRIAGLLLEEATPTLLRNLNYGGNHLLAAMTIVDPVQAVHWLEALGKDDYRRQRLATRLLSDPDDLTRRVQSDLGMLSLDDDDE